MSVTRYELKTKYRGNESWDELEESPDGMYVSYQDYEKLAAENAGLKKFCKDAAFDVDYESELGMERGGFTDALNDIKTPATDAFLAEVRASAVDEVCMKISNAIPNCYQDELVGLDAAATICGDFASELRKGVQS